MSRLANATRMTIGSLLRVVRSPADIVLAVRIAVFIDRLPAELANTDIPTFLRDLRSAPRPRARNVDASIARIRRIRDAVLALPKFWKVNTCYVRALTFYRFVDASGHEMRLHVGIEQQARLHGHAWLTLDSRLLEAPEGVALAGLREMPLDAPA